MIYERILILLIRMVRSKSWIYKFVPTNTSYPKNTIRKVKRNTIRYELDISDYQEWLIYFYCKSDSSEHVLSYLQQAKIIFDIGANIGQTSLNMDLVQKKKGITPSIYSFEPFPDTFSKLENNIRLNGLNTIQIYQAALGNEKKVLHMMKHSPNNSGGFRMTDSFENGIEVPVTTLDDFCTENNIVQCDLIKIDVEGFEIQVLEGALKTIQQYKPILIFEYSIENMQAQNKHPENMLRELIQLGYTIRSKEGISALNELLVLNMQTDLICIPPGM